MSHFRGLFESHSSPATTPPPTSSSSSSSSSRQNFHKGVPTEESSVAAMRPFERRPVDKKKVLSEKIRQTLHELQSEKKIREDLENRTCGVLKRIGELETVAPKLKQNMSKFGKFIDEESIERERGNFLEEAGVVRRDQQQTKNNSSGESIPEIISNSTRRAKQRESQLQQQHREQHEKDKKEKEDASALGASIDATPQSTSRSCWVAQPIRHLSEEDQERVLEKKAEQEHPEHKQQQAASHNFGVTSTFFTYPARDASGYVLPHGRSSKRTNYTTSYSGEKILGQCEMTVNRERMKRAQQVYGRREEEKILQAAEEARLQEIKESGGRRSSLPPVSGSGNGSTRSQEQQQNQQQQQQQFTGGETGLRFSGRPVDRRKKVMNPGESPTQALQVHMMDAAGTKPITKFDQRHFARCSSKRTLCYTDYEGRRIMLDKEDMPRTHGFVLTGL